MSGQTARLWTVLRCKEQAFQRFLGVDCETAAARRVKELCEVDSRAQLDRDPAAERLFIVMVRASRPILLNLPKREYVPAASFIDFNASNWQPIDKPGRAAATLARIAAGRRVHGDRFISSYYGNEKGGRSIHRPIGTITTRDRHAIIDGDRMRMLSVPEARAAMSFPKDYKLPAQPRLAMHMLGNAVAPLAACDVIAAVQQAI